MFLLIRHGSVDYGAHPGRFRGHGFDLLPLTPTGVAEAERLAGRLAERGDVDAIVSSPMARALQTAMIVSWQLGLRVDVELDLHEWVPDRSQQWADGGSALAAYEELRRHGGEWPEGREQPWEPFSAVRRRVGEVLDRYAHLTTVAVVCHAGVIDAMTGVRDTEPCAIVQHERG